MGEKRICILGSTGSIGTQALDVIAATDGLCVCGLGAGTNDDLLAEQVHRFDVPHVAMHCPDAASRLRLLAGEGRAVHGGPDALCQLVRSCEPDVVLTAVVGSAGLAPTLAAIEIGATLAVANKETLVCAGAVVLPAAREAGVAVLPVDSEHAGVFQCLAAGRPDEVARVTITSSGGALRDWSDDDACAAGVDDALNHPNWDMGRKVTIDSATLMNKALEMIEAHWLFDLPAEKIDAVIHPQSIVHAMVEFRDGSVIAQLAEPDMRLPIAFALHYPDRPAYSPAPLDLAAVGRLDFRRPEGRFARPIDLARRVIAAGGTAGAVLNAANEVAVERFLAGACAFGAIMETVEAVVNKALTSPAAGDVTLEDILDADRRARERACTLLCIPDP